MESEPINSGTATPHVYVEKPLSFFDTKSKGPFNIFVQILNGQEPKYISPLLIEKELFKANVKGINKIKKLNKKRILIEFTGAELANNFVKNQKQFLSNELEAFISKHLIECKGVIYLNNEITEQEALENIILPKKKTFGYQTLTEKSYGRRSTKVCRFGMDGKHHPWD